MKNQIVVGIKKVSVDLLAIHYPAPIDVSPADIKVEYRGVLPFEDWEWIGTRNEHSFSVSFNSKSGTPVEVLSVRQNDLCDSPTAFRIEKTISGYTHCFYRPINKVISVPEPKVVITYDGEGNENGRFCKADLYYTHNRNLLFINAINERGIEAGLNESVALAEIRK